MDENGNVKEQHRASRLPAGSKVKVVSPTCTRAVGRARFKMFSRRNRRITPCSQLFSRRASTPSAIQRLITATDALNYFVHGAVRRRYSRRGGCRGVWMDDRSSASRLPETRRPLCKWPWAQPQRCAVHVPTGWIILLPLRLHTVPKRNHEVQNGSERPP